MSSLLVAATQALDIVRAFVDGADDEDEVEDGYDGNGDGDSDISDDSLSDDSFHQELRGMPTGSLSPIAALPSLAGGDSVYVSVQANHSGRSPGTETGNAGPSRGGAGGGDRARGAPVRAWDELGPGQGDATATKGDASQQRAGVGANGSGGGGGIVGAIERFISTSVADLQSSHGPAIDRGTGSRSSDDAGSHEDAMDEVQSDDAVPSCRGDDPGVPECFRNSDREVDGGGGRPQQRGSDQDHPALMPSLLETGSGIAAALGIADIMRSSRHRKNEVSRAPNAHLMSTTEGYDVRQTE